MERTEEFVVSDQLVTDVGGTIGIRVLSTPGMIAMMERCASILAYENLPDGRATVGFEVCVKHVAAAAEGAHCRVKATGSISSGRSSRSSSRRTGSPTHRTPAQQARDRLRDQAHAAAGMTPLRFTRAQVRFDPDRVEATLAAVARRITSLG